MSTTEPDTDLSFDDDPDGPQDHRIGMTRANLNALEAAAKKGRDAEKNAAETEATRRENMFLRAGVDVDSDAGRMFMRGYDGDLERDEIREAAIPFGLVAAEPAPPTGGGHVLHDDTAGDVKLEPGEAGLTADRTTVASGAPPDRGIEIDPYESAIEDGLEVMKRGGKFQDAFAVGFNKLVRSAADGDKRVLIDRNSVAGRAE